ncbi:class II aldolase/adducin family protein [Streptomyces pharetrae]|uniref:class II aldolase/adducin family protein n=1 Tax=Streptomyces pharetrae TaxID=291370 RepID=UPI0036A56A03
MAEQRADQRDDGRTGPPDGADPQVGEEPQEAARAWEALVATARRTVVPTSELPMHLAVYRHTDARAVVHTHAVHATAVSTLVPELPVIHYMTAALGGPVRVAPYATYGTEALAENMLRALDGRSGCLLQNHGTVTYGATLDQAYDRTAQLEWMCRLWLTASSVPGLTPSLLSTDQLADVTERLKGYGQRG